MRKLFITSLATALIALGVSGCGQDGYGDAAGGAFAVADSLYAEGRWPEAATHYAALRDSLAATAETAGYWKAVLRWSDVAMQLGRLDSAGIGLDEALELAGDDPVREARTRYVRSVWNDRQGRFEEAEDEARRTLELARSTGDRQAEWDGLNALGRIHSLRGRYREALEVHERYLALAREIGTREDVALALNEIGIDYRRLGRFVEAARAYEEALEIFRELDIPRRIALVSYNLGNIYFDRGEWEEARRLYTLSLRTSEELGNLRGQAFAHGALGAVYSQVGNAEAARLHLSRALEINEQTGNVYGAAGTLANLGALELELGRLDMAETRLVAALAVADSAGFTRERASTRAALGRLAARRADRAAALAHSASALEIADSLADPASQYEVLAARGFVLEEVGRDAAALQVYQRAIELLESWRGRIMLGDLRLGVTQPRLEVYEGAIRLLVQDDRAGAAFEVAERARARLLLDLVAGGGAELSRERSEQDSLRQSLRELYSRWEDAAPQERAALDAEMTRVGQELVALQEDARRADPARGAARYPQPAALSEVEAAAAGHPAAVLSYFWGDRDVFGWRVSAAGVTGARLGSADSLAAQVAFLRRAIEDAHSAVDWRAAARRAYERFVTPLAVAAEGDVWVIPDGQLAYVPFEVLVPENGEETWGASRRVTYGPSASILLALSAASTTTGWEEQMLAVGAPDLDDADEVLPPLPYSEVEARELGRLFGRGGADVLLGDDATVESWMEHEPGRYRYLHFATHAVVSDRSPAATHLVFTGGRLGLAAIRSLSLRAELVTLSACETGLGRHVRGEGLIGLPHAFFATGARGVVMSLWRVSDRSAADFMSRFYRELRTGVTPAEALMRVRRAQLETGGPAAHPARWAAFVLAGGGRTG